MIDNNQQALLELRSCCTDAGSEEMADLCCEK